MIALGPTAGWGFRPDGSLRVAVHATMTLPDGNKKYGYFWKRKWLADRAAFNYCPLLGWAIEHWFEWEEVTA